MTSIWPAIAGCSAASLIRVADRRHDEHRQEERRARSGSGSTASPACRAPAAGSGRRSTIRVNDVIVTRIAGTNDSSVSRRTICSGAETAPTPSIVRSSWRGGCCADGRARAEADERQRQRHERRRARRFTSGLRPAARRRPLERLRRSPATAAPSSVTSDTLPGVEAEQQAAAFDRHDRRATGARRAAPRSRRRPATAPCAAGQDRACPGGRSHASSADQREHRAPSRTGRGPRRPCPACRTRRRARARRQRHTRSCHRLRRRRRRGFRSPAGRRCLRR